jgi:phospholipid/cholesterol/gamma-HCH transport system substrate-binding protein
MGRGDAPQKKLTSESITMETNVRYTVAGTFVLAMLALIVLAVIWLSSGFSTEKYSFYTVYMKESVDGLNKDGPVEFNGVEVGTIDDMIINAKNPQNVELRLKVKSTTPVSMGTKAKLALKGAVSGSAYILLEDKGTDKKPLVKKADERYPVIETSPSIIVRLDTTLTQINEGFHKMSAAVQSLLSPENLQSIKKLLQKLGG